jgi:hypothetical protein
MLQIPTALRGVDCQRNLRTIRTIQGEVVMRKFLSAGLAVFAGVVSAPVSQPFDTSRAGPAANYQADPRFQALHRFFEKFKCPASAYSREFLQAADNYNLDWRLLPSISYVETTCGKAAPHNNLFGWDSGRAHFSSPTEAIFVVAYRLTHSSHYRNKGVDGILASYNPLTAYAFKVKSVMGRLAAAQ